MTRSASLRESSPEYAVAGDTAAEWPFPSFLTYAVRWHRSSLGWRLIQCKFIAPEILKSHPSGSAPTATTTSSPADMVIYRSRLNAKINRNFEVFTATTGWRLKAGDCRLAAYARSHKLTCL